MGFYRFNPCPGPCCHVDLVTTGNYTTRQYQATGSPPAERWRFNHEARTWAIAIDASNRVGIVGDSSFSVTTRVLSANGVEAWSADHGDDVRGVAFDSSGNLISVGDRNIFSSLTTRKYDSSGSLLWSANHGAVTHAVAVDGSDNIYTAGAATLGVSIRRYDSDGNLDWSVSPDSATGTMFAVAVGGGFVWCGHADGRVWKLDASDGSKVWVKTFGGGEVRGLAADDDGNIYVAGERANSITHQKLDADGDVVWSEDHGASLRGIATDGAGLYICGFAASTVTHRKLDPSDGSVVYSLSHGSTLDGIAVSPSGRLHVTGAVV